MAQANVAIIGGGVTGACMAQALAAYLCRQRSGSLLSGLYTQCGGANIDSGTVSCDTGVAYVRLLADEGLSACRQNQYLQADVKLHKGQVTHKAVAEALATSYKPFTALYN